MPGGLKRGQIHQPKQDDGRGGLHDRGLMNYLAHAVLAEASAQSLVGNLLGDFCKGVDLRTVSPSVLAGLANHRAVDRYTDAHILVQQAKHLFSPQRRRFAGVALDVLFDYFLIKHWSLFYADSFPAAKTELYRRLALAEPLMPATMLPSMQRLRQQDWFSVYQELRGVGSVLDHIAGRLRFKNHFNDCLDDIKPNYVQLEQVFLQFFPSLLFHNQQWGLARKDSE